MQRSRSETGSSGEFSYRQTPERYVRSPLTRHARTGTPTHDPSERRLGRVYEGESTSDYADSQSIVTESVDSKLFYADQESIVYTREYLENLERPEARLDRRSLMSGKNGHGHHHHPRRRPHSPPVPHLQHYSGSTQTTDDLDTYPAHPQTSLYSHDASHRPPHSSDNTSTADNASYSQESGFYDRAYIDEDDDDARPETARKPDWEDYPPRGRAQDMRIPVRREATPPLSEKSPARSEVEPVRVGGQVVIDFDEDPSFF